MGLPIYWQQVAIREIERLGGNITVRKRGPEWLRRWIGNDRIKIFDDAEIVYL